MQQLIDRYGLLVGMGQIFFRSGVPPGGGIVGLWFVMKRIQSSFEACGSLFYRRDQEAHMAMKRYLFFVLALGLSVLPFLTGCSDRQESTADAGIETLDLAGMDLSYAPGDDFYRYANGGWLEHQTIPADRSSVGPSTVMAELNKTRLRSLLEEPAPDDTGFSWNERKLHDFYTAGMDSATIEQQGLSPLRVDFEHIDAVVDIQGVQDLLAEYQLWGIEGLFSFSSRQDKKNSDRMIGSLWQRGLSLPGRSYYLDENHQEIRNDYMAHIARMFELMGESATDARDAAEVILRLETRLAGSSNTPLQNRDSEALYNLMDPAGLEALAPDYDWHSFFDILGMPDPGNIIVDQPRFIQACGEMMTSVPVEEWKIFLRWKLINSTAPFLSSEFEIQNFDFFEKRLHGVAEMEPRWERVLHAVESAMGEALGQFYVSRYFPPQTRARILGMVGNLKEAMARRIADLEWMSQETREQALLKLSRMIVKIGYPDHWRDYSELEVGTDSYVRNVLRARLFHKKKNLEKIGRPVDRDEWSMTPQTINAFFAPSLNEIVFPAGVLQPPLYNPDADDAVNYGAIGFIIGHEISHGLDDQGRQYDGQGNLNDWWTAADAEEFNRRARLLVDQYDVFSVEIDGEPHFVDGELTLGENIADVAGLTVAYDAYLLSLEGKTASLHRDGFDDDQRFFISGAQMWRAKYRGGFLAERLETNVHSPGEFRVNGAFFNVPAFYQTFDITTDAALYRSEEERLELW